LGHGRAENTLDGNSYQGWRHKTPLSDHLLEVTAAWTPDYLLSPREQEMLFEKFEVLGALAFLTVTATKDELEQSHSSQTSAGPNFVWSPIGRTAWHGETRAAILSDLVQPEFSVTLLKAGFGGGNEHHLTVALESMRRLMNRIEWRF
jgi:hypothetical protein